MERKIRGVQWMRNFLAASDRRGWLLPEDKYIHTDTLARKIKLLAT